MRIPPYWAKETHRDDVPQGKYSSITACGWSFASLDDARQMARERARRAWERLVREEAAGSYDYLDRPIREEVIETIGAREQPIGIVTRNRYGALVLNTAQVMFVDIDFPPVRGSGLLESLMLALSRKRYEAKRRQLMEASVTAVAQWVDAEPSRSLRLYRTHSGLRLLLTDKLYDPASAESAAILQQLGADPMYVRLTKAQECFRARLTSKPWRCGCRRPPATYPWTNAQTEQLFRAWAVEYDQRDSRYQICRLIHVYGDTAADSIETIVKIHDRDTRVDADAELA